MREKQAIKSGKGVEFLPQTPITLFLQPDPVNILYFKLGIFNLSEFLVWNGKGLQERVAKILGLENQSLWQKLL